MNNETPTQIVLFYIFIFFIDNKIFDFIFKFLLLFYN